MSGRSYANVTLQTALAHVDEIYREIRDIQTAVQNQAWYGDAKTNILGEISKTKTLIQKIDFGALTDHQKTTVGNAVFKGLTQAKDYATIKSHTKFWDHIYSRTTKIIYKQQVALQKIINVQAKTADVSVLETPSNTVGWHPNGTADTVQFPQYVTQNAGITTAYTKLRETWEQATLRLMSFEDIYLVTTLATTYLPESIDLLQKLSKHSTLARQQGEQMFLDQLGLMQRQLDGVLAKESDTVLSAMQAQTRFLASKISTVPEKSRL